jgi:hypothetical protein
VLLANLFFDRANPFQVTPNGVGSWANCAWDMFGVPAALGIDAMIRATYAVDGGMVTGSDGIVRFLQPFRTWYDDLRHTFRTVQCFWSADEWTR